MITTHPPMATHVNSLSCPSMHGSSSMISLDISSLLSASSTYPPCLLLLLSLKLPLAVLAVAPGIRKAYLGHSPRLHALGEYGSREKQRRGFLIRMPIVSALAGSGVEVDERAMRKNYPLQWL